MVNAFFCESVKPCLGFLVALVLGFGLGLARSFAVDFAFGTGFGAVFFAAGFLAAFVFEVVGAFLVAAVVLPVWALGRDTAFCA